MKLLLEWSGNSLILDPSKSYVLGRDITCDVRLEGPRISRVHCKISYDIEGWVISDLDSTHGVFVDGKKVNKTKLNRKTKISLGKSVEVSLTPISETGSMEKNSNTNTDTTQVFELNGGETETHGPMRIRLQQRIRIGRSADNDWIISDINVSRNHAELIQNSHNGFDLVDLKSSNGTYVNGERIIRKSLNVGDVLTIGSQKRLFTRDGLESIEGIEGTSISAESVTFEIGEKALLENVSFNLGPRTLTAILGPSGAGKSTMLGVLTGRTKPTKGKILFNGADLHTSFQSLSRQIGSVPQADILHTRLTVRQALNYGAQLRLPNDTSKEERSQIVDETMRKLELSERADLRIDKLSGGQRKRASIGLELLTSPQVLVLDEPTSGLDPGLDAHVMETLRNLADDGQTVVLVTHSVDNLNYCDNVILMASGGKVAYCGPSSTVFSKLGKKSWAEVFRYLASPEAIAYAQITDHGQFPGKANLETLIKPRQSFIRQVFTLSARYMRVISSDKFYLTLLTLIPIIIGGISYLAGGKYGFGPGKLTKAGFNYNPFAQGTILVLIMGSIFIGLATSVQEIVKENPIRIREQNVGIRSSAYIISKVLILGLIVLIQDIVFVTISLFRRPMPEAGKIFTSSLIEIMVLSITLAFCAMILGLFISSLLSSSEQTMPSLVGMTMIQVVLSGALPIDAGKFVTTISQAIPSFWCTNSIAASVDLVQLNLISDKATQDRWISSAANVMHGFTVVWIFTGVFLLLTFFKVSRSR